MRWFLRNIHSDFLGESRKNFLPRIVWVKTERTQLVKKFSSMKFFPNQVRAWCIVSYKNSNTADKICHNLLWLIMRNIFFDIISQLTSCKFGAKFEFPISRQFLQILTEEMKTAVGAWFFKSWEITFFDDRVRGSEQTIILQFLQQMVAFTGI